ncbi:MAG: BatA and WFA domain-containing protein, partial [Planctomycetota bacterium]
MTFLAPIAGLVGLGLALPALVVFYLLKLRRRPVRVSSTMFWEEAVRDLQVNVPFRWIRPSLLLLLHILILLAILGAIARPAIDAGVPRAERVFLLLDRSASMRAGERFENARSRAAELVERLAGAGSPDFTVISFGATPEIELSPTRSVGAVLDAIGSLEATDEPADLRSALGLVAALGVSATDSVDEGEATPRSGLAVLISDGGSLPRGGERPAVVPGVALAFEDVGGEPVSNVGIIAFDAARDPSDPGRVRVFTRLINTAPRAAAVRVTLGFDGLASLSTSIELAPASETGASDSARSFVIPGRLGGLLTMTAEAPGDGFTADNIASVIVPPLRAPAVLLVAPAGAEGVAEPDEAIRDVLELMGLRALRVVTPVYAAALSPEQWGLYDLAVFDRVEVAVPPPISSLHFGSAWSALADAGSLERPREIGFALDWARDHPALSDVALDTLRVGRRLELSEEGVARVLARSEDGPLIVESLEGGLPRVVVGFPLEQSNWRLQIGLPVFLADTVEYLVAALRLGLVG